LFKYPGQNPSFQVVMSPTSSEDVPMDEMLTVAAVARRLGVAPATLRTWDRRYGLGPSSHEAGEHRRYSAKDLAKLTLMRRLIASGVTPADAAIRALAHKGSLASVNPIAELDSDSQLISTLFKSAKALDTDFVESTIRNAIEERGVEATWCHVVVPLLERVGSYWADTGEGIEVEHLLTEIVKRVLQRGSCKNPINAHPVILAAIGEELHCLALYALAAVLAEQNIDTHFLGARTPVEVLASVAKKSAPPAIFLWAQLSKNGDTKSLTQLPSIRPAPRVVIGGPGWKKSGCEGAYFAADLRSACEEISQAVGA